MANDRISAPRVLWIFALFLHLQVALNAKGDLWFADFRIFHLAGDLYTSGDYATLYDSAAFRAELSERLGFEVGVIADFISPPTFAWVLQAFTWLPFTAAVGLWLVAGIGVTTVSVRKLGLPVWAVPLVLLAPGGLVNLLIGQAGLLLFGLVAGLHLAIVADRRVLAGVFAGLCIIKPPLILGYALWWLVDLRRWRVSIVVAGATAAIVSIPTIVGGTDQWDGFASATRARAEIDAFVRSNELTIVDFLEELLRPWADDWKIVLSVVIVLVGLVVMAMVQRRLGSDTAAISGFAVLLSALISPHFLVYDSITFVIPLAVLIQRRVATTRVELMFAVYIAGIALAPLFLNLQRDAEHVVTSGGLTAVAVTLLYLQAVSDPARNQSADHAEVDGSRSSVAADV